MENPVAKVKYIEPVKNTMAEIRQSSGRCVSESESIWGMQNGNGTIR